MRKPRLGEMIHFFRTGHAPGKNDMIDPEAIEMPLAEAARDPALVRTLRNRLDEASLDKAMGSEYSALVSHCKKEYKVTGTYRDWLAFFGMDPSP